MLVEKSLDSIEQGSHSFAAASKLFDKATRERSILAGASDALSRSTGVNMDDEYALQLAIERNYAASARLITLIDEMFDELLRIF